MTFLPRPSLATSGSGMLLGSAIPQTENPARAAVDPLEIETGTVRKTPCYRSSGRVRAIEACV